MKNDLKIALLLAVMCAFLTCGIVIQIKTVKTNTTTVGKTLVENELRDSVLRWKQKYENAYGELEKKETELDNLRSQVSSLDTTHSDLNTKLSRYDSLLGNTDLIGPGLKITLEDGDSKNTLSASSVIVHDGDILEVVNALKNAGAEAISVNDQRIVSTTSITCAGNIIKINGEKVGSPFVIKAIGATSKLYGSLTIPGGYLSILESYRVKVKVEQVEKSTLKIPKYEGVYKFNYAKINE